MFELIYLLNLVILLSKSVLFTESSCFNLASNSSAANVLNTWVVTYLPWPGILFPTELNLNSKML